jgi:DNA polymerase V
MVNAGIFDGDLLIIDRSVEARDGKIVLGVLNGEFTIKRISKKDKKLYLIPENDDFSPIEITEEMDFQIWGVVIYSIHKT